MCYFGLIGLIFNLIQRILESVSLSLQDFFAQDKFWKKFVDSLRQIFTLLSDLLSHFFIQTIVQLRNNDGRLLRFILDNDCFFEFWLNLNKIFLKSVNLLLHFIKVDSIFPNLLEAICSWFQLGNIFAAPQLNIARVVWYQRVKACAFDLDFHSL